MPQKVVPRFLITQGESVKCRRDSSRAGQRVPVLSAIFFECFTLIFFFKFLFSNSSSRQCLPPRSVFSSYWQERSRQKMMGCKFLHQALHLQVQHHSFYLKGSDSWRKMEKEINLWKLCREWWNRPIVFVEGHWQLFGYLSCWPKSVFHSLIVMSDALFDVSGPPWLPRTGSAISVVWEWE